MLKAVDGTNNLVEYLKYSHPEFLNLPVFLFLSTETHLSWETNLVSGFQDDEIYHLKAPEGLKAVRWLWVGLTVTTQRVGSGLEKGSTCSSNLG